MATTKLKCIRCGVCCSIGPCRLGKEGENGICVFLKFVREVAVCQLVVDRRAKEEDIGVGRGCALRVLPGVYEHYKNKMDALIIEERRAG